MSATPRPAAAFSGVSGESALAVMHRRVRQLERALAEERARAEHLQELAGVKERFISVAAHDLRAPLAVVMGHLSLLEEGALGAVPEGFVTTLPQLTARLAEMDALIDGMLEASHLEDGNLRLLRMPLDACDVVHEVLQRCELFLRDGQHLRVRMPDSTLRMDGDRHRIALALHNLVHNAIKFSPNDGDVRVSVADNGATVSISVSDDGIGIAPQDVPQLFTRFGRLRLDARVAALPGTGLGLYIAREIARAHDGDIGVVSEPEAGSTFTLTLPLRS